MYSGISIRVDGKSLDLTTLKGENNLLINITNNVELFLADGATLLSENIKLLENNSDVQITLSTSDGKEVNLILKSLFELLLSNDGETPVFEVFKIGDETEEVLFSIASVDELEASAAGGAVLSDGATTDIIASDPINPDDPEINRLEGPILNSLRGNEITPSGANDLETITEENIPATVSTDSIELLETNVALTSAGTLTSTDPDNPDNLFTVSETIGTIGTFAIASSGAWTFLANSAFDALNVGDTVTEIYDVTSIDGTPSTVTITITGTNDAPIANVDTGSVLENLSVTVDVLANDTDLDDNAVFTLDSVSSAKGTVSIVNNELVFQANATDFDHLAKDVTEDVIVSYSMSDEHGAVSNSSVTITITGSNDLATITSSNSEDTTVIEAGYANDHTTVIGDSSAGGVLSITDVDDGENKFQDPGSLVKTYGTFTFNTTTGVWGYTLNDTSTATQELNAGDPATDTLTVTSFDGSDSQVITVNITGSNDLATITSSNSEDTTVIEAGYNVVGNPTAGGQVSVTDVDDGEDIFQSPLSLLGIYGTFTFSASTGVWGYILDDARAVTEALNTGENVSDTLSVTSLDGTDTYDIVVNIAGTDDNTPPIVSAASYTISEDSAVGAIVGQVVATDLETPGSLVYSFDDDGTSKYDMFLINSSTGEITFSGTDGVNPFNLDYETAPNLYQLDVKVTDSSGLFDIKTMDINVSDLNLPVTGGGTVIVSSTNNAGGSTVDNGQFAQHSEYFSFPDIVIAAGETISLELIVCGNQHAYTGSNANSYLVYDSDLNNSSNALVTIHQVDETAGNYSSGKWTITFDYENTSALDVSINTIYVTGKNNSFSFEDYTVTSPETADQLLTFNSATNNIDMLQLFSNAEDFEPDFVPTSLDIIDITAGNHILSNILAADVLVMTDSDDTLKIIGDSNDSITLPTSEWTEGATAVGITTYTATNGNGAILEIESDINIIL